METSPRTRFYRAALGLISLASACAALGGVALIVSAFLSKGGFAGAIALGALGFTILMASITLLAFSLFKQLR
jgi:hypothetical protein